MIDDWPEKLVLRPVTGIGRHLGSDLPSFLFPAPMRFSDPARFHRPFIFRILASLRRILLGYAISLVAGVLLGLGISRNKFIAETIGSLILGLQTLPSICWLPLALLWFGLNESAIVFVVVMGALLSITTATESGIKRTTPVDQSGQTWGVRHCF
jgi:NitT/TauT family transport system permease protein